MTNTQAEKIVKLLEDIDLSIYQSDIKEFDTFDEIYEFLQNGQYFDVEIIYHHKAMDYLAEHDASLKDSLEIAMDMGYTVDNINSELLASLLASQQVSDDFTDLRDEIEDVLDNEELK